MSIHNKIIINTLGTLHRETIPTINHASGHSNRVMYSICPKRSKTPNCAKRKSQVVFKALVYASCVPNIPSQKRLVTPNPFSKSAKWCCR